MRLRSLTFLGAFVATFIVQAAFAETIIFQEGANDPFTAAPYAGTDDNLIIKFVGRPQYVINNYGALEGYGVGVNASDAIIRRELVRFDLTSLAGEYAAVNSVTLKLFPAGDGEVSFVNSLQLYRVAAANGAWVEGTQAGLPETGSACWDYLAYDTTPWNGDTPETGSPIAGIAFSSVPTAPMELAFTDLSFIDEWVAGNNSGMMLRVENESTASFINFHSAEAVDGSLRPQLIIDYTPIPEPSTLVLLFGLFAILMQRRTPRG